MLSRQYIHIMIIIKTTKWLTKDRVEFIFVAKKENSQTENNQLKKYIESHQKAPFVTHPLHAFKEYIS